MFSAQLMRSSTPFLRLIRQQTLSKRRAKRFLNLSSAFEGEKQLHPQAYSTGSETQNVQGSLNVCVLYEWAIINIKR